MSLLFDLTASQPNGSGKRHGGGKYCEMLFFALCEKGYEFKTFYDSSRYINPKILDFIKDYHIKNFDITKHEIQDIVSKEGITHLYSALPEQILPWPNCTILGTIHGLRSYELPNDLFSYWQFDLGIIGLNSFIKFKSYHRIKKHIQQYYLNLLQKPNFHFVTDSEHSKKVIQQFAPQKEIPVFYPPSTINSTATCKQEKPYFLLVSANRPEKNCIRAIIALDRLYQNNKIPKDIKVNITGLTAPTFRYKLKNQHQFNFLGYVNETKLTSLYANSWCLIYPSLNEGFGYPPLEAMRYGVPVIASNAASIPEVCGESALYINPRSIRDIENKILQITDSSIRRKISTNGITRFKFISQRQDNDTQKLIEWIIKKSET